MKSYERAWRDRHVDKNLADDWLERLNSLRIFNLISICEGHWEMEHPYDARPHLNLRMKPCYLSEALAKWDDCKDIVQDTVNRLPNSGEIYVHAHLALDYLFSDASFRDEGFSMEFECCHRRTGDLPEPWFEEWFRCLVSGIEVLDKLLDDMLMRE
jgi:hypothetical protein